MGEAAVAVPRLRNLGGEMIVGLACLPHGLRRIPLHLHARAGKRQDGMRYSALVHRAQPLLAEIGQRRLQLFPVLGVHARHRGQPVLLCSMLVVMPYPPGARP
jgi:hypothetical protein